MKRFRSRWLFPGFGPPLQNATIEIDQGRLSRIGTDDSDGVDLGNVAIIPGLINAHTHLEFSSLSQPIRPLDEFSHWVRNVVAWRRRESSDPEAAIVCGLRESVRSGSSVIGEIATQDWRLNRNLDESKLPSRVVMFHELLGLSEEAVETCLQQAGQFLAADSPRQILPALSPHAPYSVHPDLFDGLCQMAAETSIPLAFHLAESTAEMQFLRDGSGPMVELLSELGVYRAELFSSTQLPIDYLQRLDRSFPVLVIHGNFLSDAEIEFLASRPRMSVVYCPRTHAAMQTREHPWRKMIQRGVNVAIGTDGPHSNPDLSIWKELKFLNSSAPEMKSSELLALATRNAARALNLSQHGEFKPGNVADLCVIPLTERGREEPERFLFQDADGPVAVMQGGRWVVEPPALTDIDTSRGEQ